MGSLLSKQAEHKTLHRAQLAGALNCRWRRARAWPPCVTARLFAQAAKGSKATF